MLSVAVRLAPGMPRSQKQTYSRALRIETEIVTFASSTPPFVRLCCTNVTIPPRQGVNRKRRVTAAFRVQSCLTLRPGKPGESADLRRFFAAEQV
jgi:hypothetical protein